MKKLGLIIILFSLFCCSTNKHLREERKSYSYVDWDQEFKDRALCLCILKGFENKKVEAEITKYDKSFYDPLAIAIFDPALEKVTTAEVEKIKADSLNSVGRYPTDLRTALEGKRIMRHCLQFYKGNELKRLAKEQKRYWKSIDTIVNEIHKKIPTF